MLHGKVSLSLFPCFWYESLVSPPSCKPMDETMKWVFNHYFFLVFELCFINALFPFSSVFNEMNHENVEFWFEWMSLVL